MSRPTLYKGIRARSRLEADYARWLDALKLDKDGPLRGWTDFEWTYEPECFAGPDGQWLPDFGKIFPKNPGYREYVEVKPVSVLTGAMAAGDVSSVTGILRRMSQAWLSDRTAVLVLDFWSYGESRPDASIVGIGIEEQDDEYRWAFKSERFGYMAWPGPFKGE